MMVSRLLLCFITLSIAACSSDSSNDGGSANGCSESTAAAPYLGCWITSGCQPMENPLTNDSIWGQIRYHFKSDGKLYEKVSVYSNANCTGTTLYQDTSDQFTDLAFTDSGSEIMDSGLTGNRLSVQDVTATALGAHDVLTTVTADNRLCLSNNLQLTADGYAFYFSAGTTVDFNNCLDKVN